jgi:peptide/nickel transport system permease protein
MINVVSMFFIFLFALPIGISSATHPHSLYDKIATTSVFVGFAIPGFWLALLLMMLFGIYLDWLPISGFKSIQYESLSFFEKIWDRVQHLILPVFVSSFGGLAGLSRYMRGSMLEVIRQDYITTARAKAPEKKIIIHALGMHYCLLLPCSASVSLIGGSVIFNRCSEFRDGAVFIKGHVERLPAVMASLL